MTGRGCIDRWPLLSAYCDAVADFCFRDRSIPLDLVISLQWRNKKWPADGVVEEDYVDRNTRKVKV
jgi:hypothetical protein